MQLWFRKKEIKMALTEINVFFQTCKCEFLTNKISIIENFIQV